MASIHVLPDLAEARQLLGPWRSLDVQGGSLRPCLGYAAAWSTAFLLVRATTDVLITAAIRDEFGGDGLYLELFPARDPVSIAVVNSARPPAKKMPAEATAAILGPLQDSMPTAGQVGLVQWPRNAESASAGEPSLAIAWILLRTAERSCLVFPDPAIPCNVGITSCQQTIELVKRSRKTISVASLIRETRLNLQSS